MLRQGYHTPIDRLLSKSIGTAHYISTVRYDLSTVLGSSSLILPYGMVKMPTNLNRTFLEAMVLIADNEMLVASPLYTLGNLVVYFNFSKDKLSGFVIIKKSCY
jgi:hypothetical protein